MVPVIDNVTFAKEFKPPESLYKANGRPFEYNGIVYSPKYFNGEIKRYEANLRNLRLFMYPDKIYLANSLHKFWHGCNHNDFFINEIGASLEAINNLTGINWTDAVIKKIEYGCNIPANAPSVINSLRSYKGKDFQPMISTGTKYGASCGFEQYRVKGYDKEYQVMKLDKICLNKPLFRWEVQVATAKYFNRFKQPLPITTGKLMEAEFLMLLKQDALNIFKNSIKMQKLQLSKLTTHEKRIVAEMLNPEIRDDIKHHNKETFKRDRRIYKKIMADKNICLNDDTLQIMDEKFSQLIQGEGPATKIAHPTCNIVGNRGNILPFSKAS